VGDWLILIFNAASKLMWIKKLLSGANRNKTCNSADLTIRCIDNRRHVTDAATYPVKPAYRKRPMSANGMVRRPRNYRRVLRMCA